MKLKTYLEKNEMTLISFAKKMGVPFSSVWYWCQTPPRKPREDMIYKIGKATKGEVQLEDWYRKKK